MMTLFSPRRHWLPVIVAGITVLVALVVYASERQIDVSTPFSSSVFVETSTAMSEEEYQTTVLQIATQYENSQNAEDVYDALVALNHIPASMQQFHIDAIIAFGKLVNDKQNVDGLTRLHALTETYSWFVLPESVHP